MSYKTGNFRKTVIARALMVAFAASVSSIAVQQNVYAQSNTMGTIYGQTGAASGATVLIESLDTGTKRTITPDANGRFQATSLPTGNYKVQLIRNGSVESSRQVEVLIGQGSEVSFGTTTVEVTSRRQTIDVTTANSGSTFTAKEIAALPIAPAIANIVQLAPGTTKGDYRYGNNAASFGGASPSENAAYINGFPVTSSLYQVGYSSLPFGSIAQAQIITGGYGAEFGRSTGGVINITTKSGTNEWEAGAGFTFAPNSMRSKAKNIYYPMTGTANNVATDGKLWNYKAGDKREEKVYNAFVSGPLIKDKLFLYFGTETTTVNRETARVAASSTSARTVGWLEETADAPRYIAKVDWNLTSDHHLEYTRIEDKSKVDDKYFGFDYATLTRNNIQGGGAKFVNYAAGILGLTTNGAALQAAQGAAVDILKYTGYLTQDLTVQAVVGQTKTPRVQTPFGYQPGVFPIVAAANNREPSLNYIPTNPQGFSSSLLREGAQDTNKGFRLDAEYKLLDKHTIRAGIDNNKISAIAGSQDAGGGTWTYLKASNPAAVLSGHNISPAAGGGFGTTGYYVDENHTSVGSTPSVDQSAQYIEDRYQATKDILLTFGLRNEQFSNKNGKGEVFVEQRHQLAPRFAATWDYFGDSSLKLFGTAGRYHLQLPANLAVRFAGASVNTDKFYTYTGINPVNGAPLGLNPISGVLSANNEFGQELNAKELAAQGLKAHYQDEINFGFEKAITSKINGGVRFTYRQLKNTIDDYSDIRPIVKKLKAMGVDTTYLEDNGWHGALFNPGKDNTFVVPVDAAGTQKIVALTAAEIGFPEAMKRDYFAVDLMLEHPMRDNWFGRLDYTWSRDKGNHEGQTHSDNGQSDVGFTSLWDFPETMINASGVLPNDRTHQIKAFGFYELTSEWAVGGNMLAASGRPKALTCNIPSAMDQEGLGLAQYGSIFYLCPASSGIANGRGALGRLPWDVRFDVNLMYKPNMVKGLLLKVDVLNLFNKQTAQAIDEGYNTRLAGDAVSGTAGQITSYTDPRSVRFSVQYNHKF